MARRVGALLAGLVLVAIGAVAYVVVTNALGSRRAHDCHLIRTQLKNTAPERAALSRVAGPTALFFGDSYSQGLELPDIRESYVYVTAAAQHWRPVVNAFGGSGYINAGPCGGQQLSSRVPAVVRQHPNIVIVQAGLNDVSKSPSSVREAAQQLFASLRRQLPAARLVVVGPHATPGLPRVDATVNAIGAAAAAEHVQFIDTRSWPLQFGLDREHLTVAGHREYGLLLAEALRSST